MTTFFLLQSKREISTIGILVSFRGKKYRKCIGEGVSVKYWNPRTKQVRETAQNPEAHIINDRIKEWRTAADNTVNFFKQYKGVPTQTEFFQKLEEERFGGKNLDGTFLVPYFDTFIERYEGVRSQSQIKHYQGCKKTLQEYEEFIGKPLRFEDIDMGFYHRFTAWFNTKGHTLNYLGEKIQIIRVVMNDARDIDHLHTNTKHNSPQFKAPHDESDTIYLSEDELMRIYHVVIDEETVLPLMIDRRAHNVQKKVAAMRKARDMFLIGAFTGLRFSDYSRLRPANIVKGIIRSKNKKTGINTSVPVHWIVQEIIDNGYDFYHPLFEQKLNQQIKDVAKLAGLDDEVIIARNVGGKLTETVHKKYELVTSHTARRSFASNAFKAGIPSLAIMKVTGHKRESTFLRYIRVSEAENADLLRTSSFFQRPYIEPPVEPFVEPNNFTKDKE